MLAVMRNAFALEPDERAAKIQYDLKELRSFRSGLIKDRNSVMSRTKTEPCPSLAVKAKPAWLELISKSLKSMLRLII